MIYGNNFGLFKAHEFRRREFFVLVLQGGWELVRSKQNGNKTNHKTPQKEEAPLSDKVLQETAQNIADHGFSRLLLRLI